jgi:ubiquinone/menaquinone biosynthesis C-methylase UbiE
MSTVIQNPAARARAVWASGDYADVAARLVPELGTILVGAAGVRPGQRVLDVAAGAGNAAISAAAGAGADVVALDVSPELLDRGREAAHRRGATLEWIEGDAAELPFADGAFDVVLSCLGSMFVPDHERTAAELVRVCKPGGTIALLSWTPAGFIGQMLKTISGFAAPPPAGAKSPVLWGEDAHLRRLFGLSVTRMETRTGVAVNETFETPLEFREYMKRAYGPTIMAYRYAEANGTAADLDEAFGALCEREFKTTPDGRPRLEKEYLIAIAQR